MSEKSKALFLRRRQRVRNKLRRAKNNRLRLSVFRSSKHIYAQIIDDAAGRTLAAASSLDGGLRTSLKNGADVAAANAVGKLIAARAKTAGIERVVFDRGAYLFHGRVKALADAALYHFGDPVVVDELFGELAVFAIPLLSVAVAAPAPFPLCTRH